VNTNGRIQRKKEVVVAFILVMVVVVSGVFSTYSA